MKEEFLFDVESKIASEIKKQILDSANRVPGLVFNYPPISVWKTEGGSSLSCEELWQNSNTYPPNLYIHIPFCRQKCSFCYFSVSVVKEDSDVIWQYLRCLEIEAIRYEKIFANTKIETVFIGGGTPSRLSEEQMEFLFKRVIHRFDLSSCREITFEGSPDSFTPGKIAAAKELGVNRLTMGVQSLDPEILRKARRYDAPEDIIDIYYHMVDSGIPNVNIDLIAGIEEEDFENMRLTMDTVFQLKKLPTQITLFTLSVREGSINHSTMKDRLPIDLFRNSLNLYRYAKQRMLESGYWQFSRNLFPRENHIFHYQDNYWGHNGYVLALGCSGYSHSQQYVYENAFHYVDYMRCMMDGTSAVEKIYPLSEEDSLRRHMVLAMKHKEIDRTKFNSYYPQRQGDVLEPFYPILESLKELNVIELDDESIRYTSEGIDVADRYVRLFYANYVNELIRNRFDSTLKVLPTSRNSFNFTV